MKAIGVVHVAEADPGLEPEAERDDQVMSTAEADVEAATEPATEPDEPGPGSENETMIVRKVGP